MRYVTEVVLRNLLSERGVPLDAERRYVLGEKTLLVGANGAGKSAIVHGIRLALRGSTDDFQGRDNVKDAGALALLASFDGDGEVYAGVKLSDGAVADWTLTREDGTNKRPDHNAAGIPDGCFVLDGIRAALAGDERTARKHFLGWVASSLSEADVLARIPEHLHAPYRERAAALAPVHPGVSPADMLLLVQASASAEVKRQEESATAYDRTATVGVTGTGERPTDAEVSALAVLAQEWRAFWLGAVRWETWTASGAQSRAELADKREALAAAVTEAQAAIQHWASVKTAVEASTPRVHGIGRALLALATSDNCPACNVPSSAEHLASMHAWHAAQENAAGASAVSAVENEFAWRRELAARTATLQAMDLQIQRAPETAPAPCAMSSQAAHEQLAAVEAEQSRLTALQGSWDAVKRARDAAALVRSTLPPLVELVKACTDATKGMLRKSAADFEARVQSFLPERWTFKLRLVDEDNPDREVFEVALIANGIGKGYTSGSQRDALLMAIAMAVVASGASTVAPVVKGKGKGKGKVKLAAETLAIALPEDRFRDEDTLRELLRAWSAFPGQVIVEAPIKPSRIGRDWTIIEVGKVNEEPKKEPDVKDGPDVKKDEPSEPDVLARLTDTTGTPTIGMPRLAELVGPSTLTASPAAVLFGQPVEPPALFLPPRATDTERTALHALTYTDGAINAMPRAAVNYVLRHNLKPDQCQIHGDGTVTVRE